MSGRDTELQPSLQLHCTGSATTTRDPRGDACDLALHFTLSRPTLHPISPRFFGLCDELDVRNCTLRVAEPMLRLG